MRNLQKCRQKEARIKHAVVGNKNNRTRLHIMFLKIESKDK